MSRRFTDAPRASFLVESEQGIFVFAVAAMLFSFIMIIGFSLDAGNLQVARFRMQRAVDAATLSSVFLFGHRNKLYIENSAIAATVANLKEMGINVDASRISATADMTARTLTVSSNQNVPLFLLGSVPGMGQDRTIGATAVGERNPIIMTLVLDCSTSMQLCGGHACSPTPLQRLRDAAEQFVGLFDQASDQIAVLRFGTDTYVVKDMATPFNKAALIARIHTDLSVFCGQTDTDEALREAANQFSRAAPDPGARNALVLITDGAPNIRRFTTSAVSAQDIGSCNSVTNIWNQAGTTPPTPDRTECRRQYLSTIARAETLRNLGVKFYVIGLGEENTVITDDPTSPFQSEWDTNELKPMFLRRLANDPTGEQLHDPAFPAIMPNFPLPPATYAELRAAQKPAGTYLEAPDAAMLNGLLQEIGKSIKGRLRE